MNDNSRRLLAGLYVLYGLPDHPAPCRCGSEAVAVDARSAGGFKPPLFVWCAGCGREGPERPTYDLALAAWNRLSGPGGPAEQPRCDVVDNATD